MKLEKIQASQFNQLEGCRKLIVNDHALSFALLDLGQPLGCYGLSSSALQIDPVIAYSKDQKNLWVGVDQRIAAVNLQIGYIQIAMPLVFPILEILTEEQFIAVLTDIEVIIFNHPTCTFRYSHGLPELAETIAFNGTDFRIQLFDGSELIVNPKLNTAKHLNLSHPIIV